jgi:Tfp pilus assembly protein PilX
MGDIGIGNDYEVWVMRSLRSLRQLLRNESGIALIMAIGMLGVLTVSGAAAVYYSSSNTRSADYSNRDTKAYSLAEAGIADGLAILNYTPNNPMTSTLLPSKTINLEGGSVTYSGVLAGSIWTITATGSLTNPTGGASNVSRVVTRQAQVVGIMPAATPPEWSRMFHEDPSTCLTIDTVTIPSPVTSAGDLCLTNGARITGATTRVQVGDDVTISSTSRIGVSAANRILRADVAGQCQYNGGAWLSPCTAAQRVFATTITTTPTQLTKPTVDMNYWYQNAKPGPAQNCTTGSFPGGFDNNYAGPGGTPDGSRGGSAEITPSGSSYTCQVKDAGGNLLGEISWNHITHVMTIFGTIFVDGDVRFDDDGQLVNYQGRAIIYAGGDLEFDERVCAGGNGTNNCWNTPSNWNPEQNMMIILTNGWSEYDQGATMPREPSVFQGVMYAQDNCVIHQAFRSSGPVICDRVDLPFNEAWPTFYAYPPLQTLIAGMMYGNPATAPEHQVIVLDQAG